MKITGAIAVVTGGARGIGLEITRALLVQGAKVVFLDIDDAQGKATENELQATFGEDHVTFIQCDVTDGSELQGTLSKISTQNQGIDILCNNAGIMDNKNWNRMLDVNLTAMIQGTMTGMDLMDKRKEGNGGVIINIASLAGLIPYEFSPVYAACKHGVVGFTRSVSQTALDRGVRVNLICPAFVTTRMTTTITDTEWVKMIQTVGCVTPERVAEGFIKLVEDDNCSGQALRVTVQKGLDFHSFQEDIV